MVDIQSNHISNDLIAHTLNDISGDVKEIKIQTMKTNGRVSALENWRAYITGGLAVVVMMLVPVVFIVVKNFLSI